MEDAKVLLTEEELTNIKFIQIDHQSVISELGLVEFQLNTLKNNKDSIIERVKGVQLKLEQIGEELNKKYGEGSINLDSGEFIPKVK